MLGDFIPWYGAEARILLAHASLWLADVVGARTLLAEASRLARRTSGAVIFEHWFDDAWSYMDALAETSLAGPSSLTIAELRILRFLPSHRSFREIAAQLGVSANTVKTQAHAVYRKLGAASRSEAVHARLGRRSARSVGVVAGLPGAGSNPSASASRGALSTSCAEPAAEPVATSTAASASSSAPVVDASSTAQRSDSVQAPTAISAARRTRTRVLRSSAGLVSA